MFVSFSVNAGIFKCTDEKGNIYFSDKKECANPDEIIISVKKSNTGKKIPNKITINNADELRDKPYAIKLSFDKEWKYGVFGYYEGFYIIHPDHVSIFIDNAHITKTAFGNLKNVDLKNIQFALFTNPDLGSKKQNWIYSEKYKIRHNLDVSESVVYKNIGFTIWTTGYNLEELAKYKIMGIVQNDNGGKKYTTPILSNDFLNIGASISSQ